MLVDMLHVGKMQRWKDGQAVFYVLSPLDISRAIPVSLLPLISEVGDTQHPYLPHRVAKT